MKTEMYYYYSLSDSKMEPIAKGRFEDESTAVEFWSQLKSLAIDDFIKIYKVDLLNEN
jgi:hypothetical protein